MTYAIAELMRLGLSHAEAVQLAAFLARPVPVTQTSTDEAA